jgi:hypothetical protein
MVRPKYETRMTFLMIDGEPYALTREGTTRGGQADELRRHPPLRVLASWQS